MLPLAIGAGWALLTPPPDLLVTGDGKHLAVRTGDGGLHLLRPRAGDYVRDQLAEGSGVQAEALDLDAMPGTSCTRDLCLATLERGGRAWHLLATRSPYFIDVRQIIAACTWADVAVSDRRLPRPCTPRWLKLDAPALATIGGVAIGFAPIRIATVRGNDRHPWVVRPPAVRYARPVHPHRLRRWPGGP